MLIITNGLFKGKKNKKIELSGKVTNHNGQKCLISSIVLVKMTSNNHFQKVFIGIVMAVYMRD